MSTKPWEHEIGEGSYRVRVFERKEKKWVLYLRWRVAGNWRHKSLKKTLRTHAGRIIGELQRWAIGQARAKQEDLIRHGLSLEEKQTRLTVADALSLITDPHTGKYPVDTPHRREVVRAGRTVRGQCAAIPGQRRWDDKRPDDGADVAERPGQEDDVQAGGGGGVQMQGRGPSRLAPADDQGTVLADLLQRHGSGPHGSVVR